MTRERAGPTLTGALRGQAAVVTGANSGVGRSAAEMLVRAGVRVTMVCRSRERGEQALAELQGVAAAAQANPPGGMEVDVAAATVTLELADMSRLEDVRAAAARIAARLPAIDILVNNAYSPTAAHDTDIPDTTEEAWDSGLAVMAKALFLATKHAIPHMERNGGGNIVNISSVHGLLQSPGFLVYEASKSAVIGMTRQMAAELGPRGIRVNAICPGHIVTENIHKHMWQENPSGYAFFEEQYPLRRCGKTEEIASAIAFLCSSEASFITGHALVVDGGLSLQLQENLGVRLAHYIQENPETELPY